ncbi:hypothetical protein G7Z17_g4120 [Cylindrodendrum hubeiense]|uniref:Aminoglycoside phosphotransferase domain-containing protein n=1 Tax=Cylindrodendrum hubeiense TaxID=595255 RepID=A0A9P5HGL6_9HYPO|nr:hypothetical protein G7Z17_g4120 [Cylindrodendrum hubeiense]
MTQIDGDHMLDEQSIPTRANPELDLANEDDDFLKEIDPELYRSDEDDDSLEDFADVLATVNLELLPELGATVRQRLDSGVEHEHPVVGKPMNGSYNILFPLDFGDGIRWLLKIPINGVEGKWDQMSAASLTAEANTMRMLKRDTTIPLPEVFDFSSTTENKIGCPYILMSHVSGLPLYDVWFGHHLSGVDPETLRLRRIRILDGIASAMVQLEPYSFETGGSPLFDLDGFSVGVGPMRQLDQQAMLDRRCIHEDASCDPLYAEKAPISDPEKFYTFLLNLHAKSNPSNAGENALLNQMISWIPEPNSLKPFVLAHPDFDVQNILVSEDGQIEGIIDWDGVVAVPRSIGNERYPGWLTRDWDPLMYGYEESMDEGVEPAGLWEDSPDTLKYYRAVYRQSILKAKGCDKLSLGTTRMSLIAENLAIAADDPACRIHILLKMVGGIFGIIDDEAVLKCFDLIEAFTEDEVDELEVAALQDGFKRMLEMDL